MASQPQGNGMSSSPTSSLTAVVRETVSTEAGTAESVKSDSVDVKADEGGVKGVGDAEDEAVRNESAEVSFGVVDCIMRNMT